MAKMPHRMALSWIYPEWFKRGPRNCTHYRGQSVTYTCRIWHGQLLPVSCKPQLNTACKCIKRDQPATSRMIRPLCNVESPNFTRTSMSTESTGTRIWHHQLLPVSICRSFNVKLLPPIQIPQFHICTGLHHLGFNEMHLWEQLLRSNWCQRVVQGVSCLVGKLVCRRLVQ